MNLELIQALATENSDPCVTISMKTYRTHPDNLKDSIQLKNHLSEAKQRLLSEFDKKSIHDLLEKIDEIESEINLNYSLDSLHIYLSNDIKQIIKSPWTIKKDSVHIADKFDITPLLKAYNRTEEYYILLLSQSGVKLYHAINDSIQSEMENDDFPFSENPYYSTNAAENSDSKKEDNLVKEYFNTVDKALVRINNVFPLKCVVIGTEDNYAKLLQVADIPSIYSGYASINYNDVAPNTLAKDAWEKIQENQKSSRHHAIETMQEAVCKGNVLTDVAEIYKAAKEGRGDLLIVHESFSQAVKMTGDYTFDIVENEDEDNDAEDITGAIAWEVFSKKGQVIFTNDDEIKNLGPIALKVRY
jgi:hypothetical protein